MASTNLSQSQSKSDESHGNGTASRSLAAPTLPYMQPTGDNGFSRQTWHPLAARPSLSSLTPGARDPRCPRAHASHHRFGRCGSLSRRRRSGPRHLRRGYDGDVLWSPHARRWCRTNSSLRHSRRRVIRRRQRSQFIPHSPSEQLALSTHVRLPGTSNSRSDCDGVTTIPAPRPSLAELLFDRQQAAQSGRVGKYDPATGVSVTQGAAPGSTLIDDESLCDYGDFSDLVS